VISSFASGSQFKLVIPPDDQRVIENMARGSLDADVQRMLVAVLDRIGVYAVNEAKSILGIGTGLAATHSISREVRKNPARRDVNSPLYDTGAMSRGIRRHLDRAAMTVTVGVRGERAFVAALHETGYSFRITDRMAHVFANRADAEAAERGGDWRRTAGAQGWADMAKWAAANVGETVAVAARPFLGPAMDRAVDRLVSEMPAVFDGILRTWLHGRAGAGNIRFAPDAPVADEPEAEWNDAWGER
jgi:hypothetical protein